MIRGNEGREVKGRVEEIIRSKFRKRIKLNIVLRISRKRRTEKHRVETFRAEFSMSFPRLLRRRIEREKEYPENVRRQVLLRREIRAESSSYLDRPPFRLEGEERRKIPARQKLTARQKGRSNRTLGRKRRGDNCCIKIANLNERSFRSTGGLSGTTAVLFKRLNGILNDR